MATRNKIDHEAKKRYEGTNLRRKPFKVSKVEDAVVDETAAHKALVQQTKSNSPNRELLTLKQAAVALGLPLHTVRKLVRSGEIKIAPTGTRGYCITREEINRFLAKMDATSF